jgi:hypothetical protein
MMGIEFTPEAIGERLRTQDGQCTAEPMYLVQSKRRIHGFDPDEGAGGVAWIDDEGEEADEAKATELDELHDDGEDHEGWYRIGYMDTWEFVTCCLTKAAAQRFIDENQHRFGEKRIFVDSGHRNVEWQAVRRHFMALDGTVVR